MFFLLNLANATRSITSNISAFNRYTGLFLSTQNYSINPFISSSFSALDPA